MTEWLSWACRACSAGWWGALLSMPMQCPHCGGRLHVTGRAAVVDLEPASPPPS